MQERSVYKKEPGADPLSVVVCGVEDGICSIECSGEINIRTAERFRDGLHDAVARATRGLIIDLRPNTRLDSVGINQIRDVARRLPPGVDLRIRAHDPGARAMLKMAGLDDAMACPSR